MAINTETKLPLHVTGDRVLQVISKVVGTSWELDTFSYEDGAAAHSFPENPERKKKPFDPSLPASKDNRWHTSFKTSRDDMRATISGSGMSGGTLKFVDGTGKGHEWGWHPECVEEDGKLITCGSHGLGIAVAKRLVQFFGGRVCYKDNLDRVDYKIDPKNARFPPKTPDQTGDCRWYQFQNALMAEAMLTSQEIRQAAKKSHNPQADYHALLEFLDAHHLKLQMNHTLSHGNPGPSRRGAGARM